MKNIISFKLFELVSYEFYLEDEWIPKGKSRPDSVDYKFTDGSNNFVVQFRFNSDGSSVRDYFVVNNNSPYGLVNGNPFRIIGTVTKITIDFIKKYLPESIELIHKRDKTEYGEHPQRAMLNKRILERELKNQCPDYSYKLVKKHGTSVSIIRKN